MALLIIFLIMLLIIVLALSLQFVIVSISSGLWILPPYAFNPSLAQHLVSNPKSAKRELPCSSSTGILEPTEHCWGRTW